MDITIDDLLEIFVFPKFQFIAHQNEISNENDFNPTFFEVLDDQELLEHVYEDEAWDSRSGDERLCVPAEEVPATVGDEQLGHKPVEQNFHSEVLHFP
ncbi:hypothetical protein Bhyg_12511 [Pseudolycoriella hygida]|uniref:Uncharacterized protein n=1 Tax=Pseudolycoriella hygida TaxID=35572 RepID=A0A9Q0MYE4_9DIPT|nr:hypothetical protein Bhyg_12511 [Pseudolycoriella hygida]